CTLSNIIPSLILDSMYIKLRKKMAKSVSESNDTYKLDRGSKLTNKHLLSYLNTKNESPKFIFMNYIEAHEGYPVEDAIIQDKWLHLSGIKPLEENEFGKLHSAYKERINYLDLRVGDALKILKNTGTLDDALVILTSDHGQSFGDHGTMYHSEIPYNSIAKVPLISVRYISGKVVRERSTIDHPASLTRLHQTTYNIASQ
ncbi:sulfatase, partial [mine drainage metagenome]